MQKRLKDLLRTLVPELRHILLGRYDAAGQWIRGDLDRELERLGVAPDGTITPLDALANPTPDERRARGVAEAQLDGLPAEARPAARREIVERAAYSWINRMIALRAMEARGLSDDTLRANPAYDGLSEALYILRQTQPERAAGADGGWWAVVEDACRAQAAALPGLFDLDDPNTALRPSTPALLNCANLIGGGLPGYLADESDAAFRDPDAIGWAYQFYQEEAKARTYAKLSSGGKVETRAEIAAVTQLFTEPYMVQWLLQNSLGRTYHEIYPDSRLPETWAYYIRPAEESGAAAADRPFTSLDDLTLIDPCMGGGHFLREAFDMLVAMYREQYPEMRAREVADRILGHHLHGIDIDPRAAQLAALTLYLRAWELVRDERRTRRLPGAGTYTPAALNLATTPTGLTPGALERHLGRHPEDQVFEPLLRGVFAALEQAPILGSLLRPAEHLDEAIRAFQRRSKGQYGLMPEDQALNRLLEELGRHDAAELKRVLLERVTRGFAADARSTGDVGSVIFGREAREGIQLLRLLGQRYVVTATNPPYMDVGNLHARVRNYLEAFYSTGKRNLYSTFILWCLDQTLSKGYVACVAPQSYLFDTEYLGLRERIVQETSIMAVASLGRHAFSEVDPPANPLLASYKLELPGNAHRIKGIRIAGSRPSDEQADLLRRTVRGDKTGLMSESLQVAFASIPGKPVAFWLSPAMLQLFRGSEKLGDLAMVREGLGTREDRRFIRFHWEVACKAPALEGPGEKGRWVECAKAGGYKKWTGLRWYSVDWEYNGARIRNFPKSCVRNEHFYFRPGLTYSIMGRRKLGVRMLPDGIFNDRAPSIFLLEPSSTDLHAVLALCNTYLASYLLRVLTQSNQFRPGYLTRLPISTDAFSRLGAPGLFAFQLKQALLRQDCTERDFEPCPASFLTEVASHGLSRGQALERIACHLHFIEALIERTTMSEHHLGESDIEVVFAETDTPSGWHPIVANYETVPELPFDIDLPLTVERMYGHLELHRHIHVTEEELSQLKSNLRINYEAGPGVKPEEIEEVEPEQESNDEQSVPGAYIPIPTETFLEELSRKVQIHPISVYRLLEELRTEGVRCKPEEQRILEDRLSVLVLRHLGHRWPRQIEAGEPVPAWADADGIIPLTRGTGDTPLAKRVEARLRAEEGDLGLQQTEALLHELTGQNLETWLAKSFFSRHVRQFKHRPVAWHLASTPQAAPTGAGVRRRKANRPPAFECLLYYHACAGDVLARIRTHYVETLLQAERRQADQARKKGNETAAALAAGRIYELEEFAGRLRRVEEEGFSCPDLDGWIESEPLDRWSGDGVFPPASRAELLANERAWHVDINDGVRANIAPLQAAGLLAARVLNAKDVPKAIADRARWRSDERRWVREGVLPRCGWMDEDVPESPAWTARAPEREAERLRLEEKRTAALARVQAGPD
ncbi:MAG: hypothetical protein JXM73_25105 [Anaerolineae bacterium]|nr:hypothetical protein [Anaerolineae bacterium]